MNGRVWSWPTLLVVVSCGAAPSGADGSSSTAGRPNGIVRVREHDSAGEQPWVASIRGVVDINSVLRIEVDPDALRRAVLTKFPASGAPVPALQMVQKVEASLAALESALPALTAALDGWAHSPRSFADLEAIQPAITAAAAPTKDLLDYLMTMPAFEARLSAALEQAVARGNPSMAEQYALAWQLATEFLVEQRRSMNAQSDVYVVFGGFLGSAERTTPVHLAGFDRYPKGERVEVPRFYLPMDQTLVDDWNRAREVAKQINAKGADDLLRLKNLTRNLMQSLTTLLESELQALNKAVDELIARGDAGIKERLEQAVAEVRAAVAALVARAQQLVGKYEGLAADPVLGVVTLISQAKDDLRGVVQLAEAVSKATARAVPALRDLVGDVSAELSGKAEAVLTRARAVLDKLVGLFSGAAWRSFNEEALRFGDDVLRLDLAAVPRDTELDLRDTGPRQAGDRLLLRLGAGRRESGGEPNVLEQHDVAMHRVLSHLTSAVGVNFVNPAGQASLQTEFQSTPAYNLLYKWGSRDSWFWNEFLRPGIGLNVTALDLDGDDVQELGLGAGVSLFRDWVQLGYGYDFGDDRAYWYFGLSLPLTEFSLRPSAAR